MTDDERKYFLHLAEKFPTRRDAAAEIVRLCAILKLPKGTEHFMSDLHGEWEAFAHIRKTASGVVKNKVELLFGDKLSPEEREEICRLIYYPKEALSGSSSRGGAYLESAISRLVTVLRLAASKYTRDVVRDHLSRVSSGFEHVIEELLLDFDADTKSEYAKSIIKTAVRVGCAEELAVALAAAIKSLLIDRLHIVGDIFDRGPRPDLIIDELMRERSIDIQWGNHDVLWMGAAAGSPVCIATVLNNSMTYKNLDLIEIGYGISLRPLKELAESVYGGTDVSAFLPKSGNLGNEIVGSEDEAVARMHKAIAIIQFKLEEEVIKRNESFLMKDRLILEQIDLENKAAVIRGVRYGICGGDFPTVKECGSHLTEKEKAVISYLSFAFTRSERLGRHIRFLYERGEMYTVYNGNLLFHGSIPMTESGEFLPLPAAGGLSGKALMDFCDKTARQGYFAKVGSAERTWGMDFLWFLWCGKNSPLSGRERIASFERLMIKEKSAHEEPKNAYYRVWEDEGLAKKILEEFGLTGASAHIVNGHIPVNKGEDPLKAGGRLIVIDGGFCKAYHGTTGIGGYTLIYNADGMRLVAHSPIKEVGINADDSILSERWIYTHRPDKMRIREGDEGAKIREQLFDLVRLIREYERGNIKESGLPSKLGSPK